MQLSLLKLYSVYVALELVVLCACICCEEGLAGACGGALAIWQIGGERHQESELEFLSWQNNYFSCSALICQWEPFPTVSFSFFWSKLARKVMNLNKKCSSAVWVTYDVEFQFENDNGWVNLFFQCCHMFMVSFSHRRAWQWESEWRHMFWGSLGICLWSFHLI